MSRVSKEEKIVQQIITREESKQMAKARENNKETKYFYKEFHERIARLGK
ncbi:hypothetical protein [Lactococcus petauri]|nr:hypothetical protein [Lactococcus petauri]